jgi:hypothetical protein
MREVEHQHQALKAMQDAYMDVGGRALPGASAEQLPRAYSTHEWFSEVTPGVLRTSFDNAFSPERSRRIRTSGKILISLNREFICSHILKVKTLSNKMPVYPRK